MQIKRTNALRLKEYSQHLKQLPEDDKRSRFGITTGDYAIDQFMLSMAYNPKDHFLWYAEIEQKAVGWGHLAKMDQERWELAVSVDQKHQRKGVGNKLIVEMLNWAKFHNVVEIYMNCIEDNRVIQHLASKHNLKVINKSNGERTVAISVPEPSIFEQSNHLLKEQAEIINDFAELRDRLFKLWTK